MLTESSNLSRGYYCALAGVMFKLSMCGLGLERILFLDREVQPHLLVFDAEV